MNDKLVLNKMDFKTYSHLQVNEKRISDRDGDLYSGAKLLLDDRIFVSTELTEQPKFEMIDNWNVVSNSYVVNENEKAEMRINIDRKSVVKQKFHIKKDSELKLYLICDLEEESLLMDVEFVLEENAELTFVPMILKGKSVYINIRSNLNGDNAKIHMESAYFALKNSDYDILLTCTHRGKNTESLLNQNGILDRGAQKSYKYVLDFVRGCNESKGEENETILTLTEDFSNTTVPVLLVGEDDIEASHGSTIGPLDEAVMDYLLGRGLPPNFSALYAMQSYFQPALDSMPRDIHDELAKRIEEIWTQRKEGDLCLTRIN